MEILRIAEAQMKEDILMKKIGVGHHCFCNLGQDWLIMERSVDYPY